MSPAPQVPKVGAQLRAEDVHPTMYCSHWFITLFAYALPFDHLLRVWDVFFLEGIKVIFRCASRAAARPAPGPALSAPLCWPGLPWDVKMLLLPGPPCPPQAQAHALPEAQLPGQCQPEMLHGEHACSCQRTCACSRRRPAGCSAGPR